MPQQQQTQPSMNIAQLQQFAINVVENVCSIIAMPVEIILRPQYGTRYFPVPVVFFSALMMIFLPLFSSVATSVVNMIPFHRAEIPVGLFSIASLSTLYFFLSFIHGLRLWRRMIYMELEQHSEFEGPPLPFFRLIPGSRSFWLTRIVLEPAFVLLAASVLERFFIIQSGLSAYLHIAALALAMKNFIGWYRGLGILPASSWTRVSQAPSSPSSWRTRRRKMTWLPSIWRVSRRTCRLRYARRRSRISRAYSPPEANESSRRAR